MPQVYRIYFLEQARDRIIALGANTRAVRAPVAFDMDAAEPVRVDAAVGPVGARRGEEPFFRGGSPPVLARALRLLAACWRQGLLAADKGAPKEPQAADKEDDTDPYAGPLLGLPGYVRTQDEYGDHDEDRSFCDPSVNLVIHRLSFRRAYGDER